MAKLIEAYYNIIVNNYTADANTNGVVVPAPSTWRQVSRRRMWAMAQAYCWWLVDTLHDTHKKDVDDTIANMKPGSPLWYVNMAKKFQYGFDLVPGKDYYDNTGIAEDVVAGSKIVAFAAFVEEPFVRLKVAKLVGNNLAKLSDAERDAFVVYMKRIKYAGVKLKDATITSGDPDTLKLQVRVKINPLVLDVNGMNRNGIIPVPDAVRGYLSNIDFNGLFSVQKLVDQVQDVDGVADLHIDGIMTQYGLLPFTSVDIDFVPDSGYLIINPVDLQITYLPV